MSSNKPYIVIFKQSASSGDIDSHIKEVESQGGKIKQRFDSEIMKGFAATMPQDHAQALTAKSGGEHIDYVEPDSEVSTQ
ncbi:hypothetical protein BCV69DRAFT_279804 [Microstroma glucosiphilum]|uniref:Inhibitor I9 domain-containing protein n=1 Tax=Pseudomicrostroma glucosiphilum TaxID=1684307 RepID=A0A316UKY9_9BASI|nr:hypothetical protein BCV69DRAFT_279804 [Pseudomicrostroma glucosiphilum]PWN23895.1 hypothetical protein BCV69DRAFT_279804 [Pseudomicrostroma glucosiphilum]